VIGLITDKYGEPVSVQAFPGNTTDTKTFGSQVEEARTRFGRGEVVFVGDRGMIKGPQIEELTDEDLPYHYITAVTKPQIEKLLEDDVIQLSLFDDVLVVMLAMKLRLELERLWHDKELTVEEGIKETATLCFTEVIKENTTVCNTLPEPRPSVKSLLDAARINLPTVMPWSGVNVATRKKLVPRRN
jgi:hypothetical protein